jgi:hypothetical protein
MMSREARREGRRQSACGLKSGDRHSMHCMRNVLVASCWEAPASIVCMTNARGCRAGGPHWALAGGFYMCISSACNGML